MSKEVGAGHVAIYPVFKGLRKSIKKEVDSGVSDAERSATKNLGKAGQKGGAALGKGLKSAMSREAGELGGKALKAFEQDVATTSRALSAARLRQQNDAGKVRIAEARLAEVVQKHGSGSSQVIAAEERLAVARRNLEDSTSRVTTASANLQTAQAKLTAIQDELAESTSRLAKSGAGAAFTTFRKNLSDLFAPVTTLTRGLTGLARTALEPVTRRLTSFGSAVGTAVIGRLRAAGAPLRDFGLQVGLRVTSALSTAEKAVTRALAPALSRLRPVATALGRSFQGAAGLARQALGTLGPVVSAVGSGISTAWSSAMAGVRRVAGDASQFVQSTFRAAATAVVATLGASLVGGFSRLSNIETAQARMRGLEMTTEEVAEAMDLANQAATGTAFSLDEMAGAAAAASLAGLRGQGMADYLEAVKGAATASGRSLSDVALVFGNVRTSGRAYTSEINQIAAMQIPIWDKLAARIGVSADEVRKLATEGKIDAETFEAAVRDATGGMAKEVGETTAAAARNMRTAFSRLGAVLLGGVFPAFKIVFDTVREGISAITTRVEPLATLIGERIVGVIEPAAARLREFFAVFKEGGSSDTSAFTGLSGMFAVLLPVLGAVVGLFGSLLARLPFLSALFGGLTAPLGLVIGALVSLLAFDASQLAAGFDSLVSTLPGVLTSIIEQIVGLVTRLVPMLVERLAANVPVLLQGGVTLLLGLVDAVTAVLPSLLQAVVGIVPTLIAALLGLVPQLLQAGLQLVLGLVQAVVVIVPQLVTAVLSLLPQLLTTILSMLPSIIEAGLQVFLGLVLALVEMIPELLTTLVGMLPQILTTLIGMIPQLLITAIDVFLALVMGLLDVVPQLLVAILGMLPQIVKTLIGLVPTLITAAVQLFRSLIDALPVIIPKLLGALGQMGPQIVNAILQIIPALFNAGVALIQGLIDGIWSMFGAVGDAVGGLMDWVGGFFPHSPAKRGPFSGSGWTRVAGGGQALAEQFAGGVRRGSRAADIAAAFGELSAQVTSASGSDTPRGARAAAVGAGVPRGGFTFISRTTDPRAAAREAFELFRRESGGLDDGGSEE